MNNIIWSWICYNTFCRLAVPQFLCIWIVWLFMEQFRQVVSQFDIFSQMMNPSTKWKQRKRPWMIKIQTQKTKFWQPGERLKERNDDPNSVRGAFQTRNRGFTYTHICLQNRDACKRGSPLETRTHVQRFFTIMMTMVKYIYYAYDSTSFMWSNLSIKHILWYLKIFHIRKGKI